MHRDMVEWRGQNPPPATMMIISDEVQGVFDWDLLRLQQRTLYNLFLAYSVEPLLHIWTCTRSKASSLSLFEQEPCFNFFSHSQEKGIPAFHNSTIQSHRLFQVAQYGRDHWREASFFFLSFFFNNYCTILKKYVVACILKNVSYIL